MMASRGMGAVAPSKMPKGVRKARRDDTDFTQYAEGGEVWNQPRPKGLGAPKKMSINEKQTARARARKAGRPYPNLVDNIRAARSK